MKADFRNFRDMWTRGLQNLRRIGGGRALRQAVAMPRFHGLFAGVDSGGGARQKLKARTRKGVYGRVKYRLADASNQSSNNYVSAAGKGGKFYARSIFAAAPGQSGSARFAFILPPDAEDAALRFSSHGACRTIIDDLKVSRVDGIDADSWIFKPDAFIGMRKTPVNPNMLDLSNPSFSLPREKYFPMIDEFGQFKHADWKGKPRNLGDIKAQIEEEKRYNASRPDIAGRDEFGGSRARRVPQPKTEGFTTGEGRREMVFPRPGRQPVLVDWRHGSRRI